MQDQLPVLVLGAVAIVAVIALVAAIVLYGRREDRLRQKLGACRTSLEALQNDRERVRKQFNAQAVELARYRGHFAPEKRLTQVFTGLPPQLPDPDEA